MNKNHIVNNKSIKNISLLDIAPSTESKPSGSMTNSNSKNVNDLKVNENGSLQVNLISLNSVPRSSSLFETETCDATLNEGYGTSDPKSEKDMSTSKEEDHKSAEIEVDVRTPLLAPSSTGDSSQK